MESHAESGSEHASVTHSRVTGRNPRGALRVPREQVYDPDSRSVGEGPRPDELDDRVSIFSGGDQEAQRFILPTLSMETLKRKFEKFLTSFQPRSDMVLEDSVSYYLSKLKQLKETDELQLVVNAVHLFEFDERLYWQMTMFPAEIIQCFDQVANQVFANAFLTEFERQKVERDILVQIVGLRDQNRMRDLQPKDMNRLISIKGIVIRCSDIYPEMKEAVFKCVRCGLQVAVPLEEGRLDEPSKCGRCDANKSFEIVHNWCRFDDKQYIKLQETPDQVPHGETPIHINLIVYDCLVDTCRPGDAVEITGIYRAQPLRLTRNKRNLSSLFKTHVDVVSVNFTHQNKIADNTKAHEESSDKVLFGEGEVQEIRAFARRPSVQEDLINIFAGSLWEMNDVKKGLLCQLFGGTPKEFPDGLKGRYRSDLNILLVGDPSTAKSQLLKCVNKVTPRGLYTSGKGSSAVGLTAYITKDPETREIVLESGALVLSDRGICCIDEFDKMDDSTKVILHEVMEQQTISIAKAGIVCSLNARTAILAAANPIESRYNPKKSIIYNIMLPPALISRFDLIYLMLDNSTEAQDERLAAHICQLFSEMLMQNDTPDHLSDQRFLSRYLAYARQNCKPMLTQESEDCLVKCYLELRNMGISRNVITATPRQLESMVRIAESLAKMRLSDTVEESDVMEAKYLLMTATQTAAMDPITGQIDMNMIATGYCSAHKERLDRIEAVLYEMLVGSTENAPGTVQNRIQV